MASPACDVCGAPGKALTCLFARRKALQPCPTSLCAHHLEAACKACVRWTRRGLLSPAEVRARFEEWVGHYRQALGLVTQEAA